MRVVAKRIGFWCLTSLWSAASLSAAPADLRVVDATKGRDPEAVRTLVAAKADVNAPQADGATALHWAAHWDDVDTAALLLRAGARVNVANDLGVTPLMLACTNGSAAMAEALLKAGADVHAVPKSGEPPLMTAALTGSVAVVNALLAHGADVNATEPTGQTALMWAVVEHHLDMVRALLDRGAEVSARSKSGFTPMLFAAREGEIEMARVLLAAGAGVNETAADGHSVLLVATVRGHVPLVKFLLEQGADPNADRAGYTPIHWAAFTPESELTGEFGIRVEEGEWGALGGLRRQARAEVLEALLSHGANPNAQFWNAPPSFGYRTGGGPKMKTGGTAFLLAAKSGDVATMRALVAAGADPLIAMDDDTTPLMMAAGYGRTIGESRVTEANALEAVKLALELGADINASNDVGETALHGAAYQGRNSVVQFLVEKGANLNAKTLAGNTPLVVAEGGVYHSGGYHPHPSTAELIRKLMAGR
jgi:ankyrin repeat protein